METLRRSIDPEKRTLFSLSGRTFWLKKRLYSRNDFAGQFYGTIEAETGGSRIQGCFDAPARRAIL
jgi:hypothetical protein